MINRNNINRRTSNMKKINYLSLAVLSLLLMMTSCESERVESNTDEQISFGIALGKQTVSRAPEFSYWGNGGEIKVQAYPTGGTVRWNEFTLTYNGTAWAAAPPAKQPGYLIDYYAWYPVAGPTGFTYDGTAATINYTVPVVASQQDLIAAMKRTKDAGVTLGFYHILSQVNFAVQGIANVKINITNISITGVDDAGVYTFGETGGSWASQTGGATYVYGPKSGSAHEVVSNTTGIVYLGNGGTGNYANTNALMLMPQTHTGGSGAISITYAITDMADTPLKNGTATVDLADFSTTTAWVMGKRYIYLVDFTDLLAGGDITFSVTVTPWENSDPVTEPIKPTSPTP